ncbi:hypothetical protein WM24_29445 [Burkholderia ubonensis]|nr:hypothetical protein WM24_29445 [Burkholderia ubonensis]
MLGIDLTQIPQFSKIQFFQVRIIHIRITLTHKKTVTPRLINDYKNKYLGGHMMPKYVIF